MTNKLSTRFDATDGSLKSEVTHSTNVDRVIREEAFEVFHRYQSEEGSRKNLRVRYFVLEAEPGLLFTFPVTGSELPARPSIFGTFQKIRERIARGEVDTIVINDKELPPADYDTDDFALEAFSRWDD